MKNSSISLRKYKGKQLVAYLRNDDFAHAGEIEAIELVMSFFKKNKSKKILDAGCGLGGTVHYLQENQWGQISGFDIESEAIDYARKHYPDNHFYQCGVNDCDKKITEQFDITVIFNAFYAFSEQYLALKSLHRLTKPNGQIAIFDYSDPCINKITPLFRAGDKNTTPFIPIKLSTIDALLKKTGWEKIEQCDINNQYLIWYENLIQRLLSNKTNILNKFGEVAFNSAEKTYTNIRNGIQQGVLGGTIIYAEKINS